MIDYMFKLGEWGKYQVWYSDFRGEIAFYDELGNYKFGIPQDMAESFSGKIGEWNDKYLDAVEANEKCGLMTPRGD